MGNWTYQSREEKGKEGKQTEGERTHRRRNFSYGLSYAAVPEGISVKGLLPVYLWESSA